MESLNNKIIGRIGEESLTYGATVLRSTLSGFTIVKAVDYSSMPYKMDEAMLIPDNFNENFFENFEITNIPIESTWYKLSSKFKLPIVGKCEFVEIDGIKHEFSLTENDWGDGEWRISIGEHGIFMKPNETVFIFGLPFHAASLVPNEETGAMEVIISKIIPREFKDVEASLPFIKNDEDIIKALCLEGMEISIEELNYFRENVRNYYQMRSFTSPRKSVIKPNSEHGPDALNLYLEARNYLRRNELFSFIEQTQCSTPAERIGLDERGLARLKFHLDKKYEALQSTLLSYNLSHPHTIYTNTRDLEFVSKQTASLSKFHYALGHNSNGIAHIIVDNLREKIESANNPQRWYILSEIVYHENTHSARMNSKYEELFCRYVSEILSRDPNEKYPNPSSLIEYKPLGIFEKEVVDELTNILMQKEINWKQVSNILPKEKTRIEEYFGNRRIDTQDLMRSIILSTLNRCEDGFNMDLEADEYNVMPYIGIRTLYNVIHKIIKSDKNFDDLFKEDDYESRSIEKARTIPGNTAQKFMIELHKQIVSRAGL